MIVLELDPNTVRPGWTALIIVIVLAVIMAGLGISMMRQMRKIKIAPTEPEPTPEPRAETDDAPHEPTAKGAEPDRPRHDSTA